MEKFDEADIESSNESDYESDESFDELEAEKTSCTGSIINSSTFGCSKSSGSISSKLVGGNSSGSGSIKPPY